MREARATHPSKGAIPGLPHADSPDPAPFLGLQGKLRLPTRARNYCGFAIKEHEGATLGWERSSLDRSSIALCLNALEEATRLQWRRASTSSSCLTTLVRQTLARFLSRVTNPSPKRNVGRRFSVVMMDAVADSKKGAELARMWKGPPNCESSPTAVVAKSAWLSWQRVRLSGFRSLGPREPAGTSCALSARLSPHSKLTGQRPG
jgi:hypothetical protein